MSVSVDVFEFAASELQTNIQQCPALDGEDREWTVAASGLPHKPKIDKGQTGFEFGR
jgi:hypothetical protein